jgi:hypothetical protein
VDGEDLGATTSDDRAGDDTHGSSTTSAAADDAPGGPATTAPVTTTADSGGDTGPGEDALDTGAPTSSTGSVTDCTELGLTECNGGCIDVNVSATNCGDCGVTCDADLPGSTCERGGCECPRDQQACPPMGCVDTTTDDLACGRDCVNCLMTAQTCIEGVCQG